MIRFFEFAGRVATTHGETPTEGVRVPPTLRARWFLRLCPGAIRFPSYPHGSHRGPSVALTGSGARLTGFWGNVRYWASAPRQAAGCLLLLLGFLALPAFPQTDSPDGSEAPDSSSAPATLQAANDSEQPYNGPALMGRDAPSELGLPRTNFTPYVEISGIYDSGLDGVVIDSQGGIKGGAAFGVQYTVGLSGARAWRHSRLALNYSGSANRYLSSAAFNNSNQNFSLSFIRQLSRHAVLKVSEAGMIYSRSFSQPTLSAAYLPALDIYGNRTSMFSSQVSLVVQKTARLSFNVTGSGGLTHQASSMVYDIDEGGLTADAQYRLSARSTAGASYSFFNYTYPGAFSSTYFHNVSGNYGLALSRRLEFSISAGFMRSGSKYLEAIPVDPLLAFLIGARSAVVINRHVTSLPSGSGRLLRTFTHGSASISGGYSVIPGNGLFLATVATNFSGSYTYSGLREWGLSAGGSYSQGKSIGTSLGHYGNSGASFSASRQIGRFTHAVISFSAIRYQSSDVSYYNRLIYQTRIGLGFSPGAIPLGPR
jgi:hypothetical protein